MTFTYAGRYGPEALIDDEGNAQKSATVTILDTTGAAAALFTDRTKAVSAGTNQVITDATRGHLTFFVDPGDYDIVTSTGAPIRVTVPVDPVEVSAMAARFSYHYDPVEYGAVPGGAAAANSTAIQAAVTAAGLVYGHVQFRQPGVYDLSTSVKITKPIRLSGVPGVVLKSSTGAVIDFQGNYLHPGYQGQVGTIEIDHLTLDATAGHVFQGANINQGSFHDLILHARSSNKSVWAAATAGASLLVVKFTKIISNTYGATRSTPGWVLQGSSTADFANITFDNCLFQNPDLDDTQYQVSITATSGSSSRKYTEQLKFVDCYFEQCFGGAIKSLSGHGVVLDNCRVYDVFAKPVGHSMFYFGQDPNSTWPSTNTVLIGTGRDLQGPNGSSTWDVELESTCLQTTIINYDVRDIPGTFTGHPYFNLGNSSGVTLLNNRAQELDNAGGTGLWNFPSDGAIAGTMAPQLTIPGDSGWLSWSYDPVSITTGSAATNGTVYLLKQVLKQPQNVAKVVVHVSAAMVTPNAGECWAALLDSTGAVLGTVAADSAWTSTGLKVMTLSGGPFVVPAGNCYIALLANAATPPSFGRLGTADAALYNGNGAAPTYRFATNGTSQTTITNRTLASGTSSTATYWSALDD